MKNGIEVGRSTKARKHEYDWFAMYVVQFADDACIMQWFDVPFSKREYTSAFGDGNLSYEMPVCTLEPIFATDAFLATLWSLFAEKDR